MNKFDQAVAKQLETMERLLTVQLEMENYEALQKQYKDDNDQSSKLQSAILKKRKELQEIQERFEAQTEEAIRSYQLMETI